MFYKTHNAFIEKNIESGGENAKDVIEMTSIVAGGKEKILNNPAIILSVSPVSPLRWDDVMAGTLLEFARNRQPMAPGLKAEHLTHYGPSGIKEL